jgi:hypothetical protein
MDLFYMRQPIQMKLDGILKSQMTGCTGLNWHDMGYKTMYVKSCGVNQKSVDHWIDKRLPGLVLVYGTETLLHFTVEKQS